MEQLDSSDPRAVGSYRLIARIGAGGMGQVYLGLSPGGRQVAVKVMHPRFAADPEFRHRFRHEIESAMRVAGMHTVPVVDADPDAPAPWLATQYIEALSLEATVWQHGPLNPGQVSALGAALAEGLIAIHKAGVVHRDLKPANILMAEDGPRIIDFGIAQADGVTRVTRADTIVGTPEFMSPEQIDDRKVGPQSDVFSLGAILAFAATGRSPFAASGLPAVTHAILNKAPDLGSVPGPLRALVAACLDKDSARRPTPAQLVTDFGALPGATSVPARALLAPQPERTVATVTPTPSPSGRSTLPPLPVRRQPGQRPRPARQPAPPLQVRPAADSWWRLAADPAGRWIAASDGDGTIAVWDPASGRPTRSWSARGTVRVLAASRGNWLATAGEHGDVRVWDVETGKPGASLDLRCEVTALAIDWPGGLLATAEGDDHVVRVWDVADPRETVPLAELPCAARPTAIAFDDTGSRIAVGCVDGRLRTWDLTQPRPGTPADTQEVQSGPVLAVTWDAAGSRWLSASADGIGPVSAAAVSAAGDGALIDGGPGRVHAFPLGDPASLRRMAGTSTTLAGVAFAEPGLLVTGGADGALHAWDTSRAALRSVPAPRRAITAVAASPDGTRVAVCDDSSRVTVFDSDGGRLVERWRRDTKKPAVAVAFSPDGKRLAAAGDGVRVWKISGEAPASPLPDSTARARALAFDRSGEYLAAAGADGVVRVWRGTRLCHALTGHKGDVYAVAFTPDGRLMSLGSDETIRTWVLAAGEERGEITDLDHPGRVLAVSPADGSVAVGCADGTVLLCTPPGWSAARVLDGHVHCVTAACFAPSGRYLATASLDGTARIWDPATGSAQLVLAPEPDGWAAAVAVGDGGYRGHGPAGDFIWQALGLDRQPLSAPSGEAAYG